MKARIAFLLILSGLAGCSRRITPEALIGRYEVQPASLAQTLEVRSDGTYTHQHRNSDGTIGSESDHWTFEYRNGEPRLTFNNFVFHLPNDSRIPGKHFDKPGFWDVEVENPLFGGLRLSINDDEGQYFIKR